MSKKIYIFRNNKKDSIQAEIKLLEILKLRGHEVVENYTDKVDMIACIGGDGTFLSLIHKCKFPTTPIIGINTGNLGFFHEASPDAIDVAVDVIDEGRYITQKIKPVEAHIYTDKNIYKRIGINEVLVRGNYSHVSQFEVSIDNTKIQDFAGDGILVATPVGSTAYNYSLGGSLVSPDLDVLQLTPVAPMSTNAYRCFHSSILLPAKDTIRITGTGRSSNGMISLSFDGKTHEFSSVNYVEISQSKTVLNLIRFEDYDYWQKLSSKLL